MSDAHYLAITGGVGGAKLALGLSQVLDHDQLVFVVNTGDDFDHLGLHISPDVDTLVYTLAALSNTEAGWGRASESWQFMEALTQLGGEDWFRLGDRDLAMHIERTRRLAAGIDLTRVIGELASALGVRHRILPMTDDPVRTPVLRYERQRPGELLHIDSKKLARIDGLGHRITGDRTSRTCGVGWEYLHVAVDDASRLAYTEILPAETGLLVHRHRRMIHPIRL